MYVIMYVCMYCWLWRIKSTLFLPIAVTECLGCKSKEKKKKIAVSDFPVTANKKWHVHVLTKRELFASVHINGHIGFRLSKWRNSVTAGAI